MSPFEQPEMNLGLDPVSKPKVGLTISKSSVKQLSPAQVQFNKWMKALEKAHASLAKERKRLDQNLHLCKTEVLPLIEKLNQVECQMVLAMAEKWRSLKFSPKRHKWLGDLISYKASDLLADVKGLSTEDISHLESLVEEIGPSFLDEEMDEEESYEFDMVCQMVENIAKKAGVKLDLGDLDVHTDPAELNRQLHERFEAATANRQKQPSTGKQPASAPKRKQSKAALEREQKKLEFEEAKKMSFKTLYKQLAKVLHPDLETDPLLKAHRENWMKRLTAARDNNDLRDMLAIEMEWLGEEADNLIKASDDKLRVYSMVLKEQTDEVENQIYMLFMEPQYELLRGLADPYNGRIEPAAIKSELSQDIRHFEDMLERLSAGGEPARKILNRWADDHARTCKV